MTLLLYPPPDEAFAGMTPLELLQFAHDSSNDLPKVTAANWHDAKSPPRPLRKHPKTYRPSTWARSAIVPPCPCDTAFASLPPPPPSSMLFAGSPR